MALKRIGIFGGTFDPIHQGHLRLAHTCQQELALEEIRFVPCAIPVHKKNATAKPWQRAAMVALAIVNEPYFVLDTRELERTEPSYTVTTLQSFTKDDATQTTELFYLLGEDALAGLTTWHAWQEIAQHCHLAVVSRTQAPSEQPIPNDVSSVIEACFQKSPHRIFRITMPLHEASSTAIRMGREIYHRPPQEALPEAVHHYVVENHLYGNDSH